MSRSRMKERGTSRRCRTDWARRTFLLGVLSVVVALFAAGCGDGGAQSTGAASSSRSGSSASKEPFTLGYMVFDLANAQYATQAEQVRRMVEAAGGRVVVADVHNDPAKQLQIAQDWLNANTVDAILGGVVDIKSFQPVLDQAAKEGTPVVFTGFKPEHLQRAQHTVTSDFVDWGRKMGAAGARCANDRLGGRGEAVIMDIPGIAGPLIPSFIRGIKQGLATNPGVQTVAQPAAADRLKSFQAMQSVLQAHPNANVVVSPSDEPVLGAMRALVAAGRDPKTELCLIGSGGNPEAAAALKSGDFYASADPQIPEIMRRTVVAAWALIKNPDDPRYSMKVALSPVGVDYYEPSNAH